MAYLHTHRSSIPLTIWEASKRVHGENGDRDFSQVLLEALRQAAESHLKACDFGLYRNACLGAYITLTEAGMGREAFRFLCETAYYDLSGLGNGETLLLEESDAARQTLLTAKLRELNGHFAFVVPSVKEGFRREQTERGLSEEAFRQLLLEEFRQVDAPFHLFSEEECADILLAVLREDAETPTKLLETAKTRLREELTA